MTCRVKKSKFLTSLYPSILWIKPDHIETVCDASEHKTTSLCAEEGSEANPVALRNLQQVLNLYSQQESLLLRFVDGTYDFKHQSFDWVSRHILFEGVNPYTTIFLNASFVFDKKEQLVFKNIHFISENTPRPVILTTSSHLDLRDVQFTVVHTDSPMIRIYNTSLLLQNAKVHYSGSNVCIEEEIDQPQVVKSRWDSIEFQNMENAKGIYHLTIKTNATMSQTWSHLDIQQVLSHSDALFFYENSGGRFDTSNSNINVHVSETKDTQSVYHFHTTSGTTHCILENSFVHSESMVCRLACEGNGKTAVIHQNNTLETSGQLYQVKTSQSHSLNMNLANNQLKQTRDCRFPMFDVHSDDSSILYWTISANHIAGHSSTRPVFHETYSQTSRVFFYSNFNFMSNTSQGGISEKILKNTAQLQYVESNSVRLCESGGTMEKTILFDSSVCSLQYNNPSFRAIGGTFSDNETHQQSQMKQYFINPTCVVQQVENDSESLFLYRSYEDSEMDICYQTRMLQTNGDGGGPTTIHRLDSYDRSRMVWMTKNDIFECDGQIGYSINTHGDSSLDYSITDSSMSAYQGAQITINDDSHYTSRIDNVTMHGRNILDILQQSSSPSQQNVINSTFIRDLSSSSLIKVRQDTNAGKINCFLANTVLECNSPVRGLPLIDTVGSVKNPATPLNLGISNCKLATNGCSCLQAVSTSMSTTGTEMFSDEKRR